jgi:hypothetical protein
LIPIAAMGVWAERNYLYRGYFVTSDMTGVAELCGLVASGTFDVECLSRTDLYDSYLAGKHRQHYYYPGFFIRHDLYKNLTHDGRYLTQHTLADLDGGLKKLVARSKRISPWQIRAVGLLRSAWWAVAWPDVAAYSREGIRLDYVTFDNVSAVRRGDHSQTVEQIRRNYLPLISDKLIYDARPPSPFYDAYAAFADWYYNGWYVAWSIAGLAAGIVLAWRGNIILAAPIYIFAANVFLNVYLLNVFSRYIHILDGFLFFEVALAITMILRRRQDVPRANDA